MYKEEALIRASQWDEISTRLASMAGTEWQDINEWLCDAARVANSRAQESRSIAKQLPTENNRFEALGGET